MANYFLSNIIHKKTMPAKKRTHRRRPRRHHKKGTLTKRVARLENEKEKKYDIFLLSNVGETNIPNSQEMSNDLGTYTGGYTLQIRDITPHIIQGTNDNERIGDQVEFKNMEFRCVCTYQPNSDLPASGKIGKGDIAHCRVLLVWDNVPTFSGPASSSTGIPTLLENDLEWNHVIGMSPNQTQTPVVALAPFSQDLVTRGKRVSVLFDKIFNMVAGTDRSVFKINLNKTWLRQKFKYLAGNAKPLNRRLKLMFVSNRVSGECPLIYCSSKTQYTDS